MTDVETPIDRYLAEQQDSTAVERFSRRHDAGLQDDAFVDAGARWYADRLPTAHPGPGEQFAFRVDLDQCTGCKSCVAACHSLNGLDEGESWRSVGQLVSITADEPHMQTVPSGCHHCVDPACLSGCPTNAYEKDPFTGIVRHLDDQCFGCGYCELTCPYEVPKLNKRLGVVRKCDMCADRLVEGEAPACVQACPTSAITITVVDTHQMVADAQTGTLVPGAPDSRLTVPTTQYVSKHPVPAHVESADHHAVHLSKAHPPLAFMLVMTQLSVGAFVATMIGSWWVPDGLSSGGAVGAALAGLVALAGSVLHLGRPLIAWRAVLGVGHSWLSREIVAFGAYAVLATGYAAGVSTDVIPGSLVTASGVAAASAGVVGVGCSALIYIVTRRTWWGASYTVTKFTATSIAAGPMFLVAVLLIVDVVGTSGADDRDIVVPAAVLSAAALLAKLVAEAFVLRPGRWDPTSDMGRTARLLSDPLATLTTWRFALGVTGVVGALLLVVSVSAESESQAGSAVLAGLVLSAIVMAELIERYQFFVASVAPRMPGGFRR